MPVNLIFKLDSDSVQLEIGPSQKIDFSGPREIAKIDIPGWRPQYQDMGCGERSAKWNGVIQEADALKKAEELQKWMDKGKELTFIYGNITAKVLIKDFNYQYYRSNLVRYDISLIETEDIETAGQVDMPAAQKAKPGTSRGANDIIGGLNSISSIAMGIISGQNLRDIASMQFADPHAWKYLAVLNGLSGSEIPKKTLSLLVPDSPVSLGVLKMAVDSVTLPTLPIPEKLPNVGCF